MRWRLARSGWCAAAAGARRNAAPGSPSVRRQRVARDQRRFSLGGRSATQCTASARSSGFRSTQRDRQASVGPLGEWFPAWPGLSGLSAVGGLEAGSASRLWPWGGPPARWPSATRSATARPWPEQSRTGGSGFWPRPTWIPIHSCCSINSWPWRGRSLETARPLASVANTGPTAMFNAQGQITDSLAPMRPGLLQAALQPTDGFTLYVRWRGRPLWWALLAAVLALFKTSSGSGLPQHCLAVVEHRRLTGCDRELLLRKGESAAMGPTSVAICLGGIDAGELSRHGCAAVAHLHLHLKALAWLWGCYRDPVDGTHLTAVATGFSARPR